jgi:histone-binding protein RBBP4
VGHLAVQDRVEHPSKDYSTQKLLLGTHTSDNEQNYLMIAEVQVRLRARCPRCL